MDEADPEGTKIAIKLTVQHTTDEELLFLKQIGLRWLHADFGEEASYDFIKTTQDRFARYGLRIDCALMEKYRSLKIQLGQPGQRRGYREIQYLSHGLWPPGHSHVSHRFPSRKYLHHEHYYDGSGLSRA